MDKYLAAAALINVITFILYGVDKLKAKTRSWRISEKVLLSFSIFCGGIGGLLGMVIFHHKTRHIYFWAINLIGAVLAAAVAVYLYAV